MRHFTDEDYTRLSEQIEEENNERIERCPVGTSYLPFETGFYLSEDDEEGYDLRGHIKVVQEYHPGDGYFVPPYGDTNIKIIVETLWLLGTDFDPKKVI